MPSVLATGSGRSFRKKTPEFVNLFHLQRGNHRHGSSDFRIHEKNVCEVGFRAGRDRGSAIDFIGVEKISDRQALDLEDAIHSGQTQAAFAIEEVRDVRLFETGFLRQAQASQFPLLDPSQEILPKFLLRVPELHSDPAMLLAKSYSSIQRIHL